jgi:hypothetical protein
MPMPVKTFSDYGADFGFMMSELPGRASREGVVIAPTAVPLKAGTVLGVITATGLYKPLTLGATDGSQNAAAILAMGQPVSTGPQRCTIGARGFEAAARMLFWPTGITDVQKKAAEAQLGTKNILVRY